MKRLIVALFVLYSAQARDLITSLRVDKNTIYTEVHKDFKREYLTDDFYVSYEPDIDLSTCDYSLLSMPFVLNVVSIVWISGQTYYVDEMDSELYESLKRVKKVFKTMYPKTQWNGKLKARTLVSHTPSFNKDPKKTALLFSGGIDSVSTALHHLDKKQLLITAWGHWDLPLSNKNLWKVRSQKIKEFAHSFGNEATILQSNYTSMLNYKYLGTLSPEIEKWRLGAIEGLGWAGLTAPILLSKGYTTLRIGSSHSWSYPYPSAASPFIDNNLRFCGLKVLHDEFEKTRLQKVQHIHEKYTSLGRKPDFLKICSFEKGSDKNCHVCRKCLTTMLCFKALNIDPTPYGLTCTSKSYELIRALLSEKKLNYYTILIGKEIQNSIRSLIAQKKQVDTPLKEILEISFDNKVAWDIMDQCRLDWSTMISLLPDDHELAIPKEIVFQ